MDKFKIGGVFTARCFDRNGKLKWEDTAKNLVPNDGLDNVLDVIFGASAKTATWYVGLKNVGAVDAADTMAIPVNWTENLNYTGDRKEFIDVPASGQSITNAASVASFAIDTNAQVIAGALLTAAATGTAGLLISVADFTGGNKSADSGDTLEVTYTVDASST